MQLALSWTPWWPMWKKLRTLGSWNGRLCEKLRRGKNVGNRQYEQLQADEQLADEWAWETKQELDIMEAEEKDAAGVEVESVSTQRLTPEEQQRWEDWAVASELGVASVPKRRRMALRVMTNAGKPTSQVLDLGNVSLGRPLQLTLTVAMDSMAGGLSSTAASSSDSVSLPSTQLVPFLESNLGALIFGWWSNGLVPSVLIRDGLGAEVLEAFQAQRTFLQDSQNGGAAK